ncbi:isocitrate dehydrogenase kinase/phosphatase [Idiomarina loihiensis]|uniref:bifunctional isocitrate dehydrogenase kinase/phosphatase n=1 Tax=Idiomarina TaxID=135575 RepID=UPI000D71A618|nr:MULTISPECIES: bifunctional isocitrate dehydrogenase kinase/phosphatase [Idiomarina]PWW36912.1 isocitrate dehydrogenase kinase/phosphatase [Idiomarina loihiensis]TDP46720.1 isocitrate dehydrogenase kinase/phosphatase [Idiomarina loihiensis]TDS22991.1 isocitrate dehydrogenase kinase/phosphatase [Idiomarina sp. H2]
MTLSSETLAKSILDGFHSHYRRFQALTHGARKRFLQRDWTAVVSAASERIHYYDHQVGTTAKKVERRVGTDLDESLWRATRQRYQHLLKFHPQAELAETFYNSVFCRVFDRAYFNNDYIFVETVLANHIPVPVENECHSYFPVVEGLEGTLTRVFEDIGLGGEFENFENDIEQLRDKFFERATETDIEAHNLRIDVLKSPFYRNKAAYIVGRVVTENNHYPFIVPVLINSQGKLYVDAFITRSDRMATIFGFARSYFMVETEAPSALVRFLKGLMPHKTLAELYSSVGFHKQGKTEFYREFLHHLRRTDDQLAAAPGVKGMVMTVFTLPSFPYVFKVIKDKLGGTKEFGRQTVIDRYRMVKRHDRVGRMADTLEFVDVALPLKRISADLLEEFKQTVANSISIEGDTLVIHQLFVERRMTPLNLYLEYANNEEVDAAMDDYGRALKEMMAANIFPGDMLLKNFGVTRHKRVVFYDYDEVRYLTDMSFRKLPENDWEVSMAPDDVFPEQIAQFAVPQAKYRDSLLKRHPELVDPAYWCGIQKNIRKGELTDVFPYAADLRFTRKF